MIVTPIVHATARTVVPVIGHIHARPTNHDGPGIGLNIDDAGRGPGVDDSGSTAVDNGWRSTIHGSTGSNLHGLDFTTLVDSRTGIIDRGADQCAGGCTDDGS